MIIVSSLILYIAISLIIAAVLIAFYLLVRLTSLLNKLLALEILVNLLMAGIALWALISNQPVYIDVCLTMALIMFLAVVAYFKFLMSKEANHADTSG